MGLDDLAGEVEEEVKALDEEEIEDHIDRVNTLSQMIVSMDKKIEELEEELETLRSVVLESEASNDEKEELDFGEEDDSPWQ